MGHKIDYILYANNYEEIDNEHPVIERFNTAEWALDIFREGAVMSKGQQLQADSYILILQIFSDLLSIRCIHEEIAAKFFASFFKNNVFVGQMRTRLGIPGYESSGPREKQQLNC